MKALPNSRIRIKNMDNSEKMVTSSSSVGVYNYIQSYQNLQEQKQAGKSDSNFQQKNITLPKSRRISSVKENISLLIKGISVFSSMALILLVSFNYLGGEFTAIIAVSMALSGAIFWNMTTQKKAFKRLQKERNKFARNYERLVRETARNRQELLRIKHQIAETAQTAMRIKNINATKGNTNIDGLENRILDGLIEGLSKIGQDEGEQSQEENKVVVFQPVIRDKKKGTLSSRADNLSSISEETDFSDWSNKKILEHISRALSSDSIDLFVQPIVNLPQRKRRFYEMYSRIRLDDDKHLPASNYIKLAKQHNMLAEIDNLLLLRALSLIQMADAANLNRSFFCNISPATLNDNKFMGDLLEFVTQYRILAPRIIFELNQADINNIDDDILGILEGLSQLGCRFSMDKVTNLNFDFNKLGMCRIRFIKVSGKILGRKIDEEGGFSFLRRLKDELDYNGIDLIVDKIETEEQLLKLLDLEIDYGQGYLFGPPKKWVKKT